MNAPSFNAPSFYDRERFCVGTLGITVLVHTLLMPDTNKGHTAENKKAGGRLKTASRRQT
jgi:hypothetical protein